MILPINRNIHPADYFLHVMESDDVAAKLGLTEKLEKARQMANRLLGHTLMVGVFSSSDPTDLVGKWHKQFRYFRSPDLKKMERGIAYFGLFRYFLSEEFESLIYGTPLHHTAILFWEAYNDFLDSFERG